MSPDHRTTQALAYQLWERRGRPEGSAEEDWAAAERQLAAQPTGATGAPSAADLDESLKDSFPASDPPASHLPDEPPSNADAQWAAAGITRTNGSG